jgi:hypothetical protein
MNAELLHHVAGLDCDEWDPSSPAQLPHRQGRTSAYGNRLFVEAARGVVWCPAHSETVATTWLVRGISNRIRGEGRAIERAAMALSGRLDSEFNRRLARFLERHLPGWQFKRNVTSIAGIAIASAEGTLGDVDILGFSRHRRAVVAIECKRMTPGLGAYETWIEHQKFDEEKGYLAKHEARRRWLEEHRDLLGRELGAAGDEVSVHAVIVTTTSVPTAHRPKSAVSVIAWWDLLAWFHDDDAIDSGAFDAGALTQNMAWTDL